LQGLTPSPVAQHSRWAKFVQELEFARVAVAESAVQLMVFSGFVLTGQVPRTRKQPQTRNTGVVQIFCIHDFLMDPS
jgi:hypothetical protein